MTFTCVRRNSEINDIETSKQQQKTVQRIDESKSWFFGKISKIVEPLTQLTKKIKNRVQMNRIRNEQGKTTYNRHQKILNISGYFKIPLRKMEKKWMNV